MRWTCTLTVPSAILSSAAISRFDLPLTMQRHTPISRSDRCGPLLASVSCPDRIHQHLRGAALEQVAFGACFEGPKDILVTTVSSENRDACVRVCAHDFLDGRHAIDFRHAQVHQNDIRAVAEKLVYSLSSVGGLANHLHIPALIDDRGQPFANPGMTVRYRGSENSFVSYLRASAAGF